MTNVTEKIYALSMENKMAVGGFGRAIMGETTPLCHNPYPQEECSTDRSVFICAFAKFALNAKYFPCLVLICRSQ